MGLPAISGFGHIDFTVTDLERSARWWDEVLGFKLVHRRERPEFTLVNLIHPCGVVIGLMSHSDPGSDRFDERVVGLDHFALQVPDRPALEAWATHLDALDVQHTGIQEETGGPLIVLRDPDNIQLELWAFDSALVDRAVASITP